MRPILIALFALAVIVCALLITPGCGPLVRIEKVEFSPDIDVTTGPLSGITLDNDNESGERAVTGNTGRCEQEK